jgi:hypothetical protein
MGTLSKIGELLQSIRQSAVIMTWYSRLAGAISLFLVLPIVMKNFAPNYVAVYLFYGTFVRFINIADLGFTLTYTRFVSYAMGGARGFGQQQLAEAENSTTSIPNFGLLHQLERNMRKTYLVVSGVFLMLFGGGATLQIRHLHEGDSILMVQWAALLLITTLRVRYKYLTALVSGMGYVHKLREIEGTYSLIQSTLLFLVAYWMRDVYALLALLVFWQGLLTYRDYHLYRQFVRPSLQNELDKPTSEPVGIWSELLPLSLKSGVGNLISVGFYQSIGFIFAGSLPAAQLVPYLFVTRFLEQTKDISMAPFYAKIPRFGTLFVQNRGQLIQESSQAIRRSLIVFVLGMGAFACFDLLFMEALGDTVKHLDPNLWILLFGAFFAERFGSMLVQMYNLTNQVRYHTLNFVVSALILAIMFALGLNNVLNYAYAAFAVFNLVFVPWSYYYFQQKYAIQGFRSTIFLYFGLLIAILLLWVYYPTNHT